MIICVFCCKLYFKLHPLLYLGSHVPCVLREYGSGNKVCVCNSTYCDTIIKVPWIYDNEYITYISSEEGLRFEKTKGQFSKTAEEKLMLESCKYYVQYLIFILPMSFRGVTDRY